MWNFFEFFKEDASDGVAAVARHSFRRFAERFDQDGFFLAGSGPLGTGGPCLLYRNDGGLRFTDVSEKAVPQVPLVGMGAAAADAGGRSTEGATALMFTATW